jgi:UDP-2,3-diacylglucosamine pyrophosphatase LpxH
MASPQGAIPQFAELYSISDLHLGGFGVERQIFHQGRRLEAFLERLAKRTVPLCLVLAGDLFDTLPYLHGAYIAVDGAAGLLQAIMEDQAFAPVFQGLRTFLEAEQHVLVVLIGNHDLEIALPEAQETLLAKIAPKAAARGQVRFSTTGVGFRCQVGDRGVYVTHGNEADRWNHVDHEALRRAAHAHALGLNWEPQAWAPNAGTKLVVDVMNEIKGEFPFIELLKPETRVALPVLSVLSPRHLLRMIDALPAFVERLRAYRRPAFVLGEEPRQPEREPPVVQLLRGATRDALEARGSGASDLEARVERLDDRGESPVDLVSDDQSALMVHYYVVNRLFGDSKSEALRTALRDWTSSDRSFDLQERDPTFKHIVDHVGRGIEVVITGHTHLPRWIEVRERGLLYLNAGAWCRTMAMRPEFLKTPGTFQPVYNALSGSLANLDGLRTKPGPEGLPLILDATLAAHVAASGRVVELRRVTDNGDEPMKPEDEVLTWL